MLPSTDIEISTVREENLLNTRARACGTVMLTLRINIEITGKDGLKGKDGKT